MCLGAPARIVAPADDATGLARAEVGGVERDVDCRILAEEDAAPAVGEWVLVHMGIALERLSEAEARRASAWAAGGPPPADR